jgi:SH3-like domain-containing protein
MNKTAILIICFFCCYISANARNTGLVTGLPLPRFITLKFSETNLRKGPNSSYPIIWVYKQKGYPMEVIEEFENWRKIKDIEDNEGWVHENLISGARSVIINDAKYQNPLSIYSALNRELIVFRYPDEQSYPMLRVEVGVIAKLRKCELVWCKIQVEDVSGWVRKENLWGVYPEEIVK